MIKLLVMLPLLVFFAVLFFMGVKHCNTGRCVIISVILFCMCSCVIANAQTTPTRLTVTLIVDEGATKEYNDDNYATLDIQQSFNEARAHFEQLGVTLVLKSMTLHAPAPEDEQPYFLLARMQQVLDIKGANVLLLITRRNLHIGATEYRGFATGGAICTNGYAVVKWYRDGNDGETIAHELAHTIGVPHDATGQCVNSPSSGFIMSSTISGAREFSQCTVEVARASVKGEACLVDFIPPPQPTTGGGALSIGWIFALVVVYGVYAIARSRTL